MVGTTLHMTMYLITHKCLELSATLAIRMRPNPTPLSSPIFNTNNAQKGLMYQYQPAYIILSLFFFLGGGVVWLQ